MNGVVSATLRRKKKYGLCEVLCPRGTELICASCKSTTLLIQLAGTGDTPFAETWAYEIKDAPVSF